MFEWFAKKTQRGAPAQPGVDWARVEEDVRAPDVAPPISWSPTVPMPAPAFLDGEGLRRESEMRRLAALQSRGEMAFQYVAETAARICEAPMAAVTVLNGQTMWLLARVGLSVEQLPVEQSFCLTALACQDVMVVPNAPGDARFAHIPLVAGPPNIVFFAGAPYHSAKGVPLGTVCVADAQVREITPVQMRSLQLLASQTALLLETRAGHDLHAVQARS